MFRMETEQTNAYNQVTEALKAVDELRTFATQGKPGRVELDEISVLLTQFSWEIIKDDISGFLAGWESKLSNLKVLNKQIKESYEYLREVSDKVAKVAEGIGVLIDISTKLIKLGL